MTESFLVGDLRKVSSKLAAIRRLGIAVAVDDFGTGYSSLSYLKNLPVNRLKIDRSFIADCPGDADDVAITRAIVGLGEAMKLDIVAEGVETAEQVEFLRGFPGISVQGYFFAKPMEANAITSYLQDCTVNPLSWSAELSSC
jgi:EAL domain-containing protein (putative c-di-GMP-specific phosphodiesterase class I)